MLKLNQTAVKPPRSDALSPCPHNQCANPHPFQYTLLTKTVCKDKDIFLIAYIHTAPAHYKRRMVIRETWGNPKFYPDVVIRVVFVMGKTFDKPEVQSSLEYESEQYGDIVQENFLDSYKNLTYKGIGALKWVSTYCPHAKFVLKADDDIFVNAFTLLRHLQSLDETGIDNKNLILCLVWNRMIVMRSGKWKVISSWIQLFFLSGVMAGIDVLPVASFIRKKEKNVASSSQLDTIGGNSWISLWPTLFFLFKKKKNPLVWPNSHCMQVRVQKHHNIYPSVLGFGGIDVNRKKLQS